MAHSIRHRTREIGLRVALGAGAKQIARLVGRDVALCLLPGIAIGLLAYLGCSRYIAPLLYGVHTVEIPPLAASVAVMAATALLAGMVPARRAISIQPAEALREE